MTEPAPPAPAPVDAATLPAKPVPVGLTPYTEQSTTILLPDDNTAFLNPVQQFNRDLSIACISTWGKEWQAEHEREFLKKRAHRSKGLGKRGGSRYTKGKAEETVEGSATEETAAGAASSDNPAQSEASTSAPKPEFKYISPEFTVLEALSATGLRAIRYAKEIPGMKYIIANDYSPTACEAMRRNVEYNDLILEDASSTAKPKTIGGQPARVRVNEGDACTLMYSHREKKVDCVDLDPYGTAAPFMDAAIQCCADGGLLAVTCTDMAVTAGHNYPEKCFANYGGVSARAEFSHEIALRLLLSSMSGIAARYGRYIVPQLSLSIDFYMRVFFRVYTGPLEVKKNFSKVGTVYICSGCQAPHTQVFGKIAAVEGKGKNINYAYRNVSGPPTGNKCSECQGALHVSGPMWLGSLHNPDFCTKVLEHVDANQSSFSTVPRIKGMVTMAKEEILTPFYFDPAFYAGRFKCHVPKLDVVGSALLNAGYEVSRTHALPGGIKTNAPTDFIHDIFRAYIKVTTPVKMEKVSQTSPSYHLLMKPMAHEIDLTLHKEIGLHISKTKLVRYQANPLANWGPAPRARNKADDGAEVRPSILTRSERKGNHQSRKVRARREEEDNVVGISLRLVEGTRKGLNAFLSLTLQRKTEGGDAAAAPEKKLREQEAAEASEGASSAVVSGLDDAMDEEDALNG